MSVPDELCFDVAHHLIRNDDLGGFNPNIIAAAKGSWLYAENGKKFLDFTSGQMASILGHSHPDIVDAVNRQVSALASIHGGG